MHRSSDIIRPKTKVAVEIHRDDGSVMEGHIYVGGQERVLDLLNSQERFIPVELPGGRVVMLNKRSMHLVVPDDSDRMAKSYQSASADQRVSFAGRSR